MRLFPLLLLTLLCTCVRAQIGLHPPRVDYRQLEADHVRLIFPEGYEARAGRVASMVDELEANHTRSIGERIFPIDIVLQTATTEINGYVGLAPFRSEFYTTPPQSLNLLSGTDWVDLLTIHEYRHVQQNSNERRGLTKLFSYLQGQYGWAVFGSIAVPNWFAEGDAVIYETAKSATGRGRTPAFSETLRSLTANDIVYSYAKARNGSFRSLVPDHYRYGYNTLTYARERFGNDVWKSVLHDGAAYKGIIYPFSRALKKKTGYGTKQLYRAAMEDLAARQDSARAARGAVVEGPLLGRQSKDVRNYRFPFVDDRGRVVALRDGFKTTPALVAIDEAGGKDEVLTSVGIQREPYVDVRGQLAVWMENRQHPRYTNERYSDVILYDLRSGRKKQLSHNAKYFSPSLSFDRRLIVVVEHDPLLGPPAIILLASNTGEVVKRFPVEAQGISYPRFSPDGQTIYFYDRGFRGNAIAALDVASGGVTTVVPRTTEPLDYLQVTADGGLIVNNGRDGVNNVYRIDPATGDQRQLTNVGIGTAFPHLSEKGYLYYAEATPRGGRLHRLDLTRDDAAKKGLPLGNLPAGPSVFERPAAWAAEAYDLTERVEIKDYEVSDFNDKLGGIKLHSWSFNGSYVSPGATVEATNALRTIAIEATARYNINEERVVSGLGITYGGLYPVLSLNADVRERNYGALDARLDTGIVNQFRFDQRRVGVTAAVPWRWVKGDFVSALTPSVGYDQFLLSGNERDDLPDNFGNLRLGVSTSIIRRRARQQVQSRLGATLRLDYQSGLAERVGNRFLLQSSLFLPGLFPTHGLRLDADFQTQNAGNTYQYANVFQYARGYGSPVSDRQSRIGVNYQLPLLYPDFGIAGITYFKRVRLNAFYDYSTSAVDQFNIGRTASSVGGQFFFDNTWVNTQDITLGFQLAYLLDEASRFGRTPVQFQLLVSGGF